MELDDDLFIKNANEAIDILYGMFDIELLKYQKQALLDLMLLDAKMGEERKNLDEDREYR